MHQVNGSVNSITITGLQSYTMYSCTIFGYSQIVGPASESLSTTTLQAGMKLPLWEITSYVFDPY